MKTFKVEFYKRYGKSAIEALDRPWVGEAQHKAEAVLKAVEEFNDEFSGDDFDRLEVTEV